MIAHSTPGLFASAHRLVETGLSALQNRVELFAVEVREERARFLEALMWASIALFLGMMAVIVLTATIVLLCLAEARPWVAGGFTALYVLGALWATITLRTRLKSRGLPFAETISQLNKDRQCVDSLK